jgi:probable HAF family extracellular repeat protein
MKVNCWRSESVIVIFKILLAASAALAQSYTVTEVGTLPGGTESVGVGINARGQIAAWSNLPNNAYGHAVLYSNGVLTDLGRWRAGGALHFRLTIPAKSSVTPQTPTETTNAFFTPMGK